MSTDFFKTDTSGRKYAGDHLLIDVWGGTGLTDPQFIKSKVEEAARRAGATVIGSRYQSFGTGEGISGMTLLSESHISVHSWPERDFAAFDVFMCGDADPQKAVDYLLGELTPHTFNVRAEKRGEDMEHKPWGQHLVLDLKGCAKAINNRAHIGIWSEELIKAIDMKPYGEPIIEHFATHSHDATGYTLVQLIETSSISAHFAENKGEAYIDIFSCKPFDEGTAIRVCQKHFNPSIIEKKSLRRG